MAYVAPRLLLMQVAGVQQHQPRQLPRCRGGDDLSLKAALHEEGEAAAVVEVRMGEQQEIYAGRIEAKGLRILFDKLTFALKEAAIDKDPLSRAFNQVAGTGDIVVGTVE
jgi:hypothetical protein